MQAICRSWVAAIVLTSALMLGNPGFGEDKEVDSPEADKVAEIVESLGLAAQLAAYGRGELNDATGLRDFTSAEALVAAGGLTLRAYKETAGQVKKPTAEILEDGKAVVDDEEKSTLEDDAEELFEEARSLATDKTAIEMKIKQAKLITSRGAVGGPQVINRTVKTGKTHNLKIGFEPNSRATVSMRGTGKTQFEVVGEKGKVLWHSMGTFGVYQWHTGKKGVRDITIRVINKGGPPVAYTVITN